MIRKHLDKISNLFPIRFIQIIPQYYNTPWDTSQQ